MSKIQIGRPPASRSPGGPQSPMDQAEFAPRPLPAKRCSARIIANVKGGTTNRPTSARSSPVLALASVPRSAPKANSATMAPRIVQTHARMMPTLRTRTLCRTVKAKILSSRDQHPCRACAFLHRPFPRFRGSTTSCAAKCRASRGALFVDNSWMKGRSDRANLGVAGARLAGASDAPDRLRRL